MKIKKVEKIKSVGSKNMHKCAGLHIGIFINLNVTEIRERP
jgi:hypothetical protein